MKRFSVATGLESPLSKISLSRVTCFRLSRQVNRCSLYEAKTIRSVSFTTSVGIAARNFWTSHVQRSVSSFVPTTLGATRRTYAPLDIVGLPKYDQLTKEERQICSDNRVVPQIYLQIKQIMIQECLKQDGLKLADIRPIVKIDVNKTRKLYDYFLQKEFLTKGKWKEN